MQWHQIEEQQPALPARMHERLVRPGVLLVVTIRRDGTPRLSPVEPFVLDGSLWLSMMWRSRKAACWCDQGPGWHDGHQYDARSWSSGPCCSTWIRVPQRRQGCLSRR